MKKVNFGDSGQILALTLVTLGLVLSGALVLASNSSIFYKSSMYSVNSLQALELAEAGIDKGIASLNVSLDFYTGEDQSLHQAQGLHQMLNQIWKQWQDQLKVY